MLRLVDIKKDYIVKDQENVHALKGVTLNFRRNEFVAILGPSGCGKTTLLNITGGLDRYTSGDLIIEGKHTKDYTDGDWDTYRNHSVGFVFQSYNLITHQTVLKNVELGLTISGVKKAERKERALNALKLVGLEGYENKKPTQMSGGQMQRVAIARALVNNPEIVMADEPTGALDSETSIQIMDLLKEVAKDRLVIMVTHNPDLAEQYATRIVNMKDGVILKDSNPYEGESEFERNKALERKTNKGSKKESSMSFKTATALSFSNLLSKLKRTVLVTIAGSIGIIGVSAVLAVSQGVNDYIGKMQDDMLSAYPITIAEESVDYTSLITGLDASTAKEAFVFNPDNPKVGVDSMLSYLMNTYSDLTSVKTNTINKELVNYIENLPSESCASLYENFGIDPTNNIFTRWEKDYVDPKEHDIISLNGLTQRYISELKTVKNFSSYASYVDLFTNFMQEIPGTEEYILSQYDMLGNSTYPRNEKELTLVVDKTNCLTDLVLAQMGFFAHNEFINIAKQAIEVSKLDPNLSKAEREAKIKEIEAKYPYKKEFNYEDLIGKELYYFPQDTMYQYGKVADNKTTVSIFLIDTMGQRIFSLSYNDSNDTIGGSIIKLSGTVSYEQVNFVRNGSKPTSPVSMKDYVTGQWSYKDENDVLKYTIDFTPIDMGGTTVYRVYNGDTSTTPSYVGGSIQETTEPVEGYYYEAAISNSDMLNNPENYGGFKMKISSILRIKEGQSFGSLERGVYYTNSFANKYISDSNKDTNEMVKSFKSYIGSEEEKTKQFNAYVTYDYLDYSYDDQNPIIKHGYASSLNGDLSTSFSDLFSSLTGVNYYETDKVHLRSVCGLKVVETVDELEVTHYSFEKLPYKISIYPKNFNAKDKITSYLDKWNQDGDIKVFIGTPQEKTLTKKDRAELTYTDTVKVIVTVINTLITTVTVALIAFTSLALVVSCFMIAVITYISVVERTKEIGIIRSAGGRKKDVSRLFIAETFMTGLSSGIFGIAITFIIELIMNVVVYNQFKISMIANLTLPTALIMLAISIVLSVVSGLVPSIKASNQDPVVALRSE